MKKLKTIAENTLMLMSFRDLLGHVMNCGDVVQIIIVGICCLVVLVATVKDNQYLAINNTINVSKFAKRCFKSGIMQI